MILPLQTFSALMENMAAGVQGASTQLIDLSVGSVLRALLEACGAVALWMQWLILQVLSVTRAATSNGPDLDSWMADFALTRLAGSPSVGSVTFARYTTGVAATIPVGALLYTTDRTQSFTVVAQPGNPAWNGSGGYTLAALAGSINVPVQAVNRGASGNILPGAIGWLAASIPGVDTVSNQQTFTGGVDAENDVAFRSRFQLYINSRSQCTASAVEFAIASLQQGLRYTVVEGVSAANLPQAGNFWVVIDDGSGSPPATLIASASAAISAVRPIGSTYAVTGPSVLPANVEMYVVTSNPTTASLVQAQIAAAIGSWIQALSMSGTLAISKLEAIAHNADPTVISVLSTTINGVSSDLTASTGQVITVAGVVVN